MQFTSEKWAERIAAHYSYVAHDEIPESERHGVRITVPDQVVREQDRVAVFSTDSVIEAIADSAEAADRLMGVRIHAVR